MRAASILTNIPYIKNLFRNVDMIENCSLCPNELLRASCPPPFGPAELFKFIPDEFVRKNLAAIFPLILFTWM